MTHCFAADAAAGPTLRNRSVTDIGLGTPRVVALQVYDTGEFITISQFSSTVRLPEWFGCAVAGIGALFEARLTVLSGNPPTFPSSSVGVWISVLNDPYWELRVNTSPDSLTGNWRIDIRNATTQAIVASASFFVQAASGF